MCSIRAGSVQVIVRKDFYFEAVSWKLNQVCNGNDI